VDASIAKSILEEQNLKPWTDYGSMMKARLSLQKDSYSDECYGLGNMDITKSIVDDYYKSISSSGLVMKKKGTSDDADAESAAPKLRVAYTAMHGIGHKWAVRSYETFGLDPFFSVPEQQEPDYLFPTVPFPNPEENGALIRAMEFAEKNDCDLILANDPDADRLAVAERCRKTKSWTTFSGDQIGTMLGLRIWETIGKDCGKVSSFACLMKC
jgi:phosphomannomutase